MLSDRTNVVIELFVIYKADYSLYNGSYTGTRRNSTKFFSSVILLPRITIVYGQLILYVICRMKWNREMRKFSAV